MNVLMTVDAVGGVWPYAVELARALARHNVAVTLACMGPRPSAPQRAELAGLPNVSLHAREYRLEWMPQPWDDVDSAGAWLLELAERSRADIIHLNGYAHAALPWRAPVLVVAHSCVVSWWHAVHGNAPPREWAAYFDRVSAGLNAAHLVAAPSRSMLAAVRRHYGYGGGGAVIPNGRSADQFAPAAKRRVIMSAGRLWDEAKNVAALARVAGGLAWPVEVAGSAGCDTGDRTALAGVRLLGVLDQAQLAARMRAAAIYALPAFYEPFGLTVLEAALSGCALVLGDIDSLRENWDGAALFVAPGNDAELLSSLRELCRNGGLRRVLAHTARARARQFTPARMAAAYHLSYNTLLEASHQGSELPCAS